LPIPTHYPDSEPTSLVVFDLTRSGLEPTIYNTRGKHTNHYTTDAVSSRICFSYLLYRPFNITLMGRYKKITSLVLYNCLYNCQYFLINQTWSIYRQETADLFIVMRNFWNENTLAIENKLAISDRGSLGFMSSEVFNLSYQKKYVIVTPSCLKAIITVS
jgi:hypothetical protein